MQHAESIAMRLASFIENASARRIKGRSPLAHIVKALHVSRHLEAKRALRRYHHLITEDFQDQPGSAVLDFNKRKESRANANGDNTRVGASGRSFKDA
jgi:hypothetical protein